MKRIGCIVVAFNPIIVTGHTLDIEPHAVGMRGIGLLAGIGIGRARAPRKSLLDVAELDHQA